MITRTPLSRFIFFLRAVSPHVILLTLLSLLSLFLGACSLLNPGPAPVLLQLHPALPPTISTIKAPQTQLIVAMPTAGRDLDTDAIALLFRNREVRYLAGSRWTNSIPSLVQHNLIDGLNATGAFRGVANESTGIVANTKLLSEIRQFNLRYESESSPPVAEVVISMQVLDLVNGNISAAKTFQATAPASGNDNIALAAACEAAFSQALGEIAPWVAANAKKGR